MARHVQTPFQRHRKENPSFSSTLLDAIYQSIDRKEEEGFSKEELFLYRDSMRKTNKHNGEDMASFRRACMVDKWMDKKAASDKLISRCKSMVDFDRNSRNVRDHPVLLNSSSTSSDSSSSAGGFSSSESESAPHYAVKPSSTSCYNNRNVQRPKPIRTSLSVFDGYDLHEQPKQQQHREGGFVKTKSRALKIYSDLKKVKQPISPGGRLATFLNSVFSGKKPGKVNCDSDQKHSSKSGNTSTCSSASSFSRSCLSKTPSSNGKSGGGTKRSVRFYPVSVIVDEDCRPCGHKNLHQEELSQTKLNSSIDEELKLQHAMEEKRRVQEAAMDLLKNYCKNQNQNHTLDLEEELDEADEEEDDDDASCASSDLFELDNLSAIGIDQRYNEELPVYETTHLGTNRAIANGLIL